MLISEAFDVLYDAKRKFKYDRSLRKHTRGRVRGDPIDIDIADALGLFANAFGMHASNINWEKLSVENAAAWVKEKAKTRYVP